MGKKMTVDQHKVDILALNRLVVLDSKGQETLISNFWKSGPVVLIFLRHFSCIACRLYVKMIWDHRKEFEKNKTRVVFIGNGAAHFIDVFKDDLKIPEADIFTDPSLESFKACGLIKGIFNLLDPRGMMKMVEFSLKGEKQGPWDKASGVHTQMGGVVLIKPPGIVNYHYIEDFLGDFDTGDDWKQALTE